VVYIFFKYVASDDEEPSEVQLGSRRNAPPALTSDSAAVDFPLQPSQAPTSPGLMNVGPLKRIVELGYQLPKLGEIFKRIFSIAGRKFPPSIAQGGSLKEEPANLQPRAESPTSIAEVESTSIGQVSFCRQTTGPVHA
jgi:hypothetical protein